MKYVCLLGCLLVCLLFNTIVNGEEVDANKRILLNDDYYTIISKLDTLEKKVAALEADHGARNSHEQVAFMAYLTKSITGHNHHIYFDDVKLNLGNGYNPHHGTFVVPVNGTYQFTVTACSAGAHFIVLEITVNTSILGKVIAGDNGYDECTTKLFLAQLHTGDDVFVQHVSSGDYLYAHEINGYPSFTGVLLQAN